jgi:hypothetical protein
MGLRRIQLAAGLEIRGWGASPGNSWLLTWVLEASRLDQDTAGCLPGYKRLTGLRRIQLAAGLEIRGWQASPGNSWLLTWVLEASRLDQDTAGCLPEY